MENSKVEHELVGTSIRLDIYKEFTELIPSQVQEEIETASTAVQLEQFFNDYEKLFYDIPKQGENGSHEYLYRKSKEYANIDEENEIVEALINEITDLRQQIVERDTQILELQQNNIPQ